MNTQFTSIASTRARYYLKNSPVQFVLVELLKASDTNEIAVTLTFKNISAKVLNSLNIQFICKDADNNIIVQESFSYNNLNIKEGELFGANDAVYISNVPISNVEVKLVNVAFEGKLFNLMDKKNIALPELKELSDATAYILSNTLNIKSAKYMPCNVKDGWQCTCGAFNYNVSQGKFACSECNTKKEELINAVKTALNKSKALQQNQDENVNSDENIATHNENVENAQYNENTGETKHWGQQNEGENNNENIEIEQENLDLDNANEPADFETYYNNRVTVKQNGAREPQLMKNETADKIIKFAPIFTGIACILYFVFLLLMDTFL